MARVLLGFAPSCGQDHTILYGKNEVGVLGKIPVKDHSRSWQAVVKTTPYYTARIRWASLARFLSRITPDLAQLWHTVLYMYHSP